MINQRHDTGNKPATNECQRECTICHGDGYYYEPCGEDYSMVPLTCNECDGRGTVAKTKDEDGG